MINFNKDKLLITLTNIFLYISFVLVYFHVVGNKIIPNYWLINIVLLTCSIIMLALFIHIRIKFYNKNNIDITRLTKKNRIILKLFVIFEILAILIVLISTILSASITINNRSTNLIIYNILLALIFLLTISSSFMETVLRIKMTYNSNIYEEKLEINN